MRGVLLLVVGCSVGCSKGGGGGDPHGTGALSIPGAGKVRIVATKIRQTPDEIHWKWSVIGERNWSGATASDQQFGLSKTYPLNSPSQRGGCNIWECDLTARRVSAGGTNTLRWNNVLHGSVGTTATADGSAPLPAGVGPSDNLVQIEQDRDVVVGLPANITLATVGGKPVTLHIATD